MEQLRTPNSVLGWYFAAADERPHHGDGSCASESILDALDSASGPILYRVELSGEISRDRGMLCATRRRYVARMDVTPELRAFARACALDVIDRWEPSEVVKNYLRTGDEALRAEAWSSAWRAAENARSEAWAAAGSAVGSARNATESARSAMCAAMESAARNATEGARNAAYSAAWSEAWIPAWSTVGSASWAVTEIATEIATWEATYSAARSVQARRLHDMVVAIPDHRVQIIG